MFHSHQRREGLSVAIFGLWRNWTIAIGILAVLAFVSPLISQGWLAPICVLLFLVLQGVRAVMNNQHVPVCSRLYKEVAIILLVITTLVVIRCLTTQNGDSLELTGQPVNTDGPLMGILMIAPISAIIATIFLLQKEEPLVCQLCHLRYGNVVRNGFIGRLYHKEWRYQTRFLLIMSIFLTIVEWSYYMIHYINVNLNSADHFFFIWLPFTVYIASLIYLGRRYYFQWIYFCHNDEDHLVENPSSTTVRFLVISGDKMLFDIRFTNKYYSNGAIVKRFDTPARATLPYQERFDTARATELFKQISGINDAEIRPIYDSPDNVTYRNIFHYFAFLESCSVIPDSKLKGEWFTLGEIRQLMDQSLTDADFNSELARIYRIAMAWKTYDRNGRRLYPIKHYRPTFRIKDIKNWDVDYNDGHWLEIGRLNQDCCLFRLRWALKRLQDKLGRNATVTNIF